MGGHRRPLVRPGEPPAGVAGPALARAQLFKASVLVAPGRPVRNGHSSGFLGLPSARRPCWVAPGACGTRDTLCTA
eukprot:9349945-Alexandrium_andersonii.AAC.1